MLRIGQIAQGDQNPLMNVSPSYEETVRKLSAFDFPDKPLTLLACLILSQTEKQYKKYLLYVLKDLSNLNLNAKISAWQESAFEVSDGEFRHFLTDGEWSLLKDKNLEDHLEEEEKALPFLFADGLSTTFYPTKKKGTLLIRHLVRNFLESKENLNSLQKTILYFTIAQLLISWESSCVHLGLMILNNWELEETENWFTQTWPIYR